MQSFKHYTTAQIETELENEINFKPSKNQTKAQ